MSRSANSKVQSSRISVLAGSASARLLLALPFGGVLWLAVLWAWGANS